MTTDTATLRERALAAYWEREHERAEQRARDEEARLEREAAKQEALTAEIAAIYGLDADWSGGSVSIEGVPLTAIRAVEAYYSDGWRHERIPARLQAWAGFCDDCEQGWGRQLASLADLGAVFAAPSPPPAHVCPQRRPAAETPEPYQRLADALVDVLVERGAISL